MALPKSLCDREQAKFLEGLSGETLVQMASNGAIPEVFDDIVLSYTGANVTKVEYKLNAAIIRTLNLTYTGARLDRVQVS